MNRKDLVNRLRRFDAYPKTLEDFRVKTFGGATVTIVSGLLMFILFVSELNYYLTTEVHQELFVDTTKGQKLRINIDITYTYVGCSFLSVDAMDVSGEQQINVDHNIYKQRLDLEGVAVTEPPVKEELGDQSEDEAEEAKKPLDPGRCESCYGAESALLKCCNTCEDVREAYRQKGWAFTNAGEIEQCKREGFSDRIKEQQNEGCRIFGYLEVNKVAGNFHIAPGKSFSQNHVHVHDMQGLGGKFNLTHRINHLSFGDEYPGQVNPLDASEQTAQFGMYHDCLIAVNIL